MVNEEWRGRKCCAQGDVCRFENETLQEIPYFFLVPFLGNSFEWIVESTDENSHRSRNGKLESGIPDDGRLRKHNKQKGYTEAVECIRLPLKKCADLWYGEHEDRPPYGGRAACHGNVQEQKANGNDSNHSVRKPRRLQEYHEDSGE